MLTEGDARPILITKIVGVMASEDDSSQTSCGVAARVPTIPNWLADISQEGAGVAEKR